MLVLNRRKGETVIIGDNIRITIVDVQGDNIKIGIDAPRNINILREEIHEEVIAANRQASQQVDAAKIEALRNLKANNSDGKS
jgi:carbon storage regulator